VADRERLQLGRDKRRPAPRPRVEGGPMKRFVAWNKHRRAVKKRRLAKMSRPKRVLRRVGIAGTWLLALITVGLLGFVALFYTLSNVPSPQSLPLAQTAVIEYSDGSTLAKIGTVNRTAVSLDQVPEQVRWDVVAAEDRNFFSEPGVSIEGTLRAVISDLTGGDTQGGSGIAQQYAKNAYLSDARTLTRKVKELMIALKLSREYSKNQILEFYLNTVYFGRGAYGIQAAAQTFFGEDVSKLTVSQGALLAALLRAPSYYDPAANPQQARARWQYVIDGMVTIGRLTQAQADALKFPKTKPPSDTAQLGASGWRQLIVYRVIQELKANGVSESAINQRGLVIRTTINRHAQHAALVAINQTFAHLTKQQRNMKNALVAVDPKSGAVLAYYGGKNGKDYNGKIDNFDYAGIGTRPPGSSFKPYTLATVLTQTLNKTKNKPRLTIDSYVDGSYCVKIEGRQICNDPGDQSLSGPSVTIANAMKWSLNTTFDQLAEQAGPANVAKTAHAMGIPDKDTNGNPLLVGSNGKTGFGIGIGDYPVSPIDQAVGYATLANGGTANAAYFVQSATDSSGNLVYKHKADPQRALDPKVANDVTLTLEPVAEWSHDGLANGRKSAAKTGTEGIFNDPNNNNSDAWMVGFTPQVSAAVWTGSGNSTTPIYNSYGGQEYGADLPGKTWKLFMDTYLANKPELPMPTKQMITNGSDIATPPATNSAPATHSSSAPASSASTSPTAPTTSASSSPSPPPSAPATVPPGTIPPSTTEPTATCTPTVLHPCP
jgi:membrane peptidoglycan carboxypeptidase